MAKNKRKTFSIWVKGKEKRFKWKGDKKEEKAFKAWKKAYVVYD